MLFKVAHTRSKKTARPGCAARCTETSSFKLNCTCVKSECVQNQLEAVNRGLYEIYFSLIINPEEATPLEKGDLKWVQCRTRK